MYSGIFLHDMPCGTSGLCILKNAIDISEGDAVNSVNADTDNAIGTRNKRTELISPNLDTFS